MARRVDIEMANLQTATAAVRTPPLGFAGGSDGGWLRSRRLQLPVLQGPRCVNIFVSLHEAELHLGGMTAAAVSPGRLVAG